MMASSWWIWVITHSSFILLVIFLAILDSIDGSHVSNRQSNASYIYIYIYISYMPVYLPVKINTRMFLKQLIFYDAENSTPLVGSNPRTLDYILSSINSRNVSDHQSNASEIYYYILRDPKQEFVYGNDKNMNCRCPMTAILNYTTCGKTVPFTAWHMAKMDSAQKLQIETSNEVLFLLNAHRSLSRALFQFLSWLVDVLIILVSFRTPRFYFVPCLTSTYLTVLGITKASFVHFPINEFLSWKRIC